MIRMMLTGLLLLCGVAQAQTTPNTPAQTLSQTPPMAAPAPAGATGAPSTAAYEKAMASMMHGMDAPYTGNADHDFVTGMLPHHQGAIDMARVELRYGKDPALRKLARDIIASQAKEQVFMRKWLAAHPVPATPQ